MRPRRGRTFILPIIFFKHAMPPASAPRWPPTLKRFQNLQGLNALPLPRPNGFIRAAQGRAAFQTSGSVAPRYPGVRINPGLKPGATHIKPLRG